MPKLQPIGYLFSVQEPGGLTRKLYATVADTIADAQVFVGNYLNITNQQIEFYKLLTDEELAQLGLKRGEVKRYA
jgi:hypothetical protein